MNLVVYSSTALLDVMRLLMASRTDRQLHNIMLNYQVGKTSFPPTRLSLI